MTNKINGIDVSEYFIDVVDEGGSTIDYEILPNSERLLVEKIFEQNQQFKRLQEENNILKQTIKNKNFVAIVEENKRLQMLSCANCGEKYLSPDGAELYEKNVQLQEENEELKKRQITKNGFICDCEQNVKYKQALEEIREIIKTLIIEMPEYHDCYYKDECGDNCTPKKQSKVEYCCFENVDKVLTIINEVLKCQ